MIMNGDIAYLKHISYLTILQPLLITQTENLLREWGQLRVDVVVEGIELFLLFVFLGSFLLEWSQFHLHGLFSLLVYQQIDATVTDTRQQKALQRV